MLKRVLYTSATIATIVFGLFNPKFHQHNNMNPTAVSSTHAIVNVDDVGSAVGSIDHTQALQLAVSVDNQETSNVDQKQETTTTGNNLQSAVSDKTASQTLSTTVASSTSTAKSSTSVGGNLQWLIQRESGGNPNAQNNGMHGIGQLSEAAYATYAPGQDYRGNYDVQLSAMQAYIADRYGSVDNAVSHFQSSGWY